MNATPTQLLMIRAWLRAPAKEGFSEAHCCARGKLLLRRLPARATVQDALEKWISQKSRTFKKSLEAEGVEYPGYGFRFFWEDIQSDIMNGVSSKYSSLLISVNADRIEEVLTAALWWEFDE